MIASATFSGPPLARSDCGSIRSARKNAFSASSATIAALLHVCGKAMPKNENTKPASAAASIHCSR